MESILATLGSEKDARPIPVVLHDPQGSASLPVWDSPDGPVKNAHPLPSHTVGGIANRYSCYGKQSGSLLKN